MTTDPPLRARMPTGPPSPGDLKERDRFAALAADSLATVRASAQAWRNGLAAFITLVTTGVVIKGRDTTAGLGTGWKVLITVFVAGGLALAVVGLWQALAAEAGTGTRLLDLEAIRRDHGSLDAYQVTLSANAAKRLQRGRYVVAGALICLLAGVIVTWWAPAQAASSSAYLKITDDNETSCGTPQTVGHEQLHLIAYGTHQITRVPFIQITSLSITKACP
jgi:hypothetical protein